MLKDRKRPVMSHYCTSRSTSLHNPYFYCKKVGHETLMAMNSTFTVPYLSKDVKFMALNHSCQNQHPAKDLNFVLKFIMTDDRKCRCSPIAMTMLFVDLNDFCEVI